jgi:hypothetical protein
MHLPLACLVGTSESRTVRGHRVRSHEESRCPGISRAKNPAEPHHHHHHFLLHRYTTRHDTQQWHSRSRARGCWSSPRFPPNISPQK